VAGRTTSLRLRLRLLLLPLVHVRVLVRGRELVVQHRRQLLVLWVRVDVGEMAVGPAVARGGFVLASLPLLVLEIVSERDAGGGGGRHRDGNFTMTMTMAVAMGPTTE
jgi:hypothetical protein